MQKNIFFFSFGCPNVWWVDLVGTKSQVFPKISLEGSPKHVNGSEKCLQAWFISGLKSWFSMVKTGVMGRDEDCSAGLR